MTPHCTSSAPSTWHPAFLDMLPTIERHARYAFRHLQGDDFDDAVQETIAHTCDAFVRLVKRRRENQAFASVLVRFAVAQILEGRRFGSRLRIGDVLSPYARHHKQFVVERLQQWDRRRGEWLELTVCDRRSPIPDQVCFRLDFRAWLRRLTRSQRRIALALAMGNAPGEVARMLQTSPSWVSQTRRRLQELWDAFQNPEGNELRSRQTAR